MRIQSKLVKASFVARVNRFAALVRLEGSEVLAHVPNSGRLRELFTPGRTVYLAPRPSHHRKTSYDLLLVVMDNLLVSCDARLPTPLVEEAIHSGKIPPFQGYSTIKREAPFGNSRLDLRLSGPSGHCFLETKSVTLIVDGTALFPTPLPPGVGDICRVLCRRWKRDIVRRSYLSYSERTLPSSAPTMSPITSSPQRYARLLTAGSECTPIRATSA